MPQPLRVLENLRHVPILVRFRWSELLILISGPWHPRGVMNEILFHYEKIDPTTWAYLASLLIIGLFFKFGRFWSVRNLDLLLLILLAPGLLLVSEGQKTQREAMAAVAAARQAASLNEAASPAGVNVDSASHPALGESPVATGPSPPGSSATWTSRMRPRRRTFRNGKKARPSRGGGRD